MTPDDASRAIRAGLLAEAQAAGADQSQLDLLAQDTITLSDIQNAHQRAWECALDAGWKPRYGGSPVVQKNEAGEDVLFSPLQAVRPDTFTIVPGSNELQQVPLSAVEELAYRCNKRFYWFIEQTQSSSPAMITATRQFQESHRLEFAQCLRDNGVDVVENATWDEVMEVYLRGLPDGPRIITDANRRPIDDCIPTE